MGCVATDSVTINQIGTPMTLTMTSTAPSCPTCCDICVSANPTGGIPPYNLIWTPGNPNGPPCSACPFETLEVTVTDSYGCTAVNSITTDTIATTGLEDTSFKNTIDIYPNPSSGILIIDVINYSSILFVSITDANGNVVLTTQINQKTTKINNNELPTGMYFINISDGEKIIQTNKWVKQ